MTSFLHTAFDDLILTTPQVGAYILFALGIVFVFRASRILNLAHGAMAMLPTYVFISAAGALGVYGALPIALAVGAALGLVMERTVVRRLRGGTPLAQTVGTVGVFGLLLAFAVQIWGTAPQQAPTVFPHRTYHVGFSLLHLSDIALLVVALALTAAFLALFRFTDLGLAMRCAADNRTAARLMGMDPDRTTATAWIFAGILAALGGVLLGASTVITPYILALAVLPAFVAALLGGLDSIVGTVWGSVIVCIALGIVPTLGSFGKLEGAPEVAVGIVAFAAMALRGRRFALADQD